MGDIKQSIRDLFYEHVHLQHKGDNEPRWRGVHVVKFPTDLILYQEAIYENRPEIIIETGTKFGGSALFFADMLSLCCGGGEVVTVDIEKRPVPADPRIEYVIGSSRDRAIVDHVASRAAGKKTMIVLDSDHRRFHVKWELHRLGRLVTPGQFMVVEDCFTRNMARKGPGQAVEWYLARSKKFRRETPEDKYFVAVTRGGWLRRV